jgi:predicted DNA-binding protein with PD1-like motif
MQFASMEFGKLFILRVEPGKDVLASIRQASDLRQAVVLSGYGTLVAYHLHWVTHHRIPTENLFRHSEGGTDILSMNGLIVDGEPHIHMTLSTSDGAFGGHLEPGCKAYVLCEIFFTEISAISLTRRRTPVSVDGMGTGEISRLLFSGSNHIGE